MNRHASTQKSKLAAAILHAPPGMALVPVLERGFALLGGIKPPPTAHIVIKPNLTSDKYPPCSGVTVDVDLTAAVVEVLAAACPGCRFSIVESESDGAVRSVFSRLGYTDWARTRNDVELVDLGTGSYSRLVIQEGPVRSIEIPDLLLDMDYYVNIAVLKRHMQERFSGVWKNAYGLPSNHVHRMRKHPFLKEILFAMNTYFRPDLNIIDARIALRGPGPFVGEPQKYAKLLMSKDPLACDLTALRLIDELPRQVPLLKYAARRLGIDPGALEIAGDDWQPQALPFVNSEKGYRIYRFGLWLRRLGGILERFGFFSMLAGAAMREGNAGQYMGGGTQSLGASLRAAWDIIARVDLGEVPFE